MCRSVSVLVIHSAEVERSRMSWFSGSQQKWTLIKATGVLQRLWLVFETQLSDWIRHGDSCPNQTRYVYASLQYVARFRIVNDFAVSTCVCIHLYWRLCGLLAWAHHSHQPMNLQRNKPTNEATIEAEDTTLESWDLCKSSTSLALDWKCLGVGTWRSGLWSVHNRRHFLRFSTESGRRSHLHLLSGLCVFRNERPLLSPLTFISHQSASFFGCTLQILLHFWQGFQWRFSVFP